MAHAFLALAFVLLRALRAAAARTDVVILINGDHLTGEVKLLDRGQLTFKTDDAGTLTIKWTKITSITTAGDFDVAARDGRRFVGRLASAAGQLAVVAGPGGDAITLPMEDVVSLAPIRRTFLQKLDGSLDLGASYTQESGVAQLTFNSDTTFRRPSFAAYSKVSFTLTQQPEADDTQRIEALFGYTRFRPNRWVVNPIFLLERNAELGFDLRTTGALSLGRYLVQSNGGQVLLAGGAAVGREWPMDGDPVTNVDGLVVFTASVYTYDYPKTNMDVTILGFPGLNDPGRVRINTNVKFKRELFRDFYFSISAYDSYDNRPTSVDAGKNDVGFSLTLGWTF